jgi:hypothetical protein
MLRYAVPKNQATGPALRVFIPESRKRVFITPRRNRITALQRNVNYLKKIKILLCSYFTFYKSTVIEVAYKYLSSTCHQLKSHPTLK